MEECNLYTKILNWWKSKKINDSNHLDEVLNAYKISFTFNSAKIENDAVTYHDTREIFDHNSVTSYTGDLRTLFEIHNSKIAYEFLLKSFDNRTPISLDFIKELHKILTKGTYDNRRYEIGERPGQFKKHDYVTGKEEIGASYEDVEEELLELLEELEDVTEANIIISSAYFHVKFENIHPFADGNGRTGRLLVIYLLLFYNHPPIIFPSETKKEYYACLEQWDKEQKLDLMVSYLKSNTAATWSNRAVNNRNSTMKKMSLNDFLTNDE